MAALIAGYAHPDYARSLNEFGEPVELRHCGGWALARPIPGSSDRDLIGCYPLFCCQDWSALERDLEELGNRYVSLGLVTDPFAELRPEWLARVFDLVRPFKTHYVRDLSIPVTEQTASGHRRNARKALKRLLVREETDPTAMLDEWERLFENLRRRHRITGIRAFSRAAFAEQAAVPGYCLFTAWYEGCCIGAQSLYQVGQDVYGHLAAYSEVGYQLDASYALKWAQFEVLRDRARRFYLGASAGVEASTDSGLDAFKRGWATDTIPVWFCGRILNPERYAELTLEHQAQDSQWFPSYRLGVF